MSKIQGLLNEVIENFTSGLGPLEAQLEEAKQKEKFAKLKLKIPENTLVDVPNEEALSKFDQNTQEAYKEIKEAQELQEQLEEVLEEKCKSIQRHIAQKYPAQIVEAVNLARSEGYDPNPIYQGEGEYKGHSLLYFISAKLFGDITAEILPYLRPEDIKQGPGVESELMIAIKTRNIEAINWLVENDPNLNYPKASGSTALHMSCMMKDYDTTKRLLEKGADPNVVNTYGCTPLFDVIIRASTEAAEASHITEELMVKFLHLLKDYQADFNLKNNEGQTVFEQYLAPRTPFCKADINSVRAALEILNLEENIDIDLTKKYINKFFTNMENLNKLISQNVDVKMKVTALCKVRRVLIQFASEQTYPEQKALNYFEEFACYDANGVLIRQPESNEAYKPYTKKLGIAKIV